MPRFDILPPPLREGVALEEYLTVPDVAELLKLSAKSVYRLAQRGELPGFKAGGTWRFRRRDIDAWAAALVKQKKGEKQ